METSAKTGANVHKVFLEIAKIISEEEEFNKMEEIKKEKKRKFPSFKCC